MLGLLIPPYGQIDDVTATCTCGVTQGCLFLREAELATLASGRFLSLITAPAAKSYTGDHEGL